MNKYSTAINSKQLSVLRLWILTATLYYSVLEVEAQFNISEISINTIALAFDQMNGTVRWQGSKVACSKLLSPQTTAPQRYQITPNSIFQFKGMYQSIYNNGTGTISAQAFYTNNGNITITPIILVQCSQQLINQVFCQPADVTLSNSEQSWTSRFFRLAVLQAISSSLALTIQFQFTPPGKYLAQLPPVPSISIFATAIFKIATATDQSIYYSCADFFVVPASEAIRNRVSDMIFSLMALSLFTITFL